MVNQEYYNLGTAPSVIRQLFAYGLEQAAKVGADKVYDYSLGNVGNAITFIQKQRPLLFPLIAHSRHSKQSSFPAENRKTTEKIH